MENFGKIKKNERKNQKKAKININNKSNESNNKIKKEWPYDNEINIINVKTNEDKKGKKNFPNIKIMPKKNKIKIKKVKNKRN